jgi:two-component system chemotaxis response regulator CheB
MKALSLGASDFITKPVGGTAESNRKTAEQLVSLVKGYGSTYRKRKVRLDGTRYQPEPAPAGPGPAAPVSRPSPSGADNWPEIKPKKDPAPPEIIAIGISTGGPNALRQVFANLSGNLTVPIVVVQHMPAGFTAEFANSLNKICPLEVKEAADGDIIKPGRILIAPGDKHIKVEKRRLAAVAHVVDGENVNGHKPSVGVLFDSVAEQYGNASLAIIMTGMGRDGAREIGGIFGEGGTTVAQDEESSVVFGMPRVAIEHNYIMRIASLDQMAGTINEICGV